MDKAIFYIMVSTDGGTAFSPMTSRKGDEFKPIVLSAEGSFVLDLPTNAQWYAVLDNVQTNTSVAAHYLSY